MRAWRSRTVKLALLLDGIIVHFKVVSLITSISWHRYHHSWVLRHRVRLLVLRRVLLLRYQNVLLLRHWLLVRNHSMMKWLLLLLNRRMRDYIVWLNGSCCRRLLLHVDLIIVDLVSRLIMLQWLVIRYLTWVAELWIYPENIGLHLWYRGFMMHLKSSLVNKGLSWFRIGYLDQLLRWIELTLTSLRITLTI